MRCDFLGCEVSMVTIGGVFECGGLTCSVV